MSDAAPPSAPLRIAFLTLFPRMLEAPLGESLLGKAAQKGLVEFTVTDVRDHAHAKHKNVDDTPYGGGAGMVMKPEPLVLAIEAVRARLGDGARVVLLDPQGATFDQATARRFAAGGKLALVCGRYEGVDERVRAYVDEACSVGDFILTGGEFAALCVADAVARLVPGVLGNDASPGEESFAGGLLEYPQYTRPAEFRGAAVPEVLTSGDHEKIRRWRLREALRNTRVRRPDLWEKLAISGQKDDYARLLTAGDIQYIERE